MYVVMCMDLNVYAVVITMRGKTNFSCKNFITALKNVIATTKDA